MLTSIRTFGLVLILFCYMAHPSAVAQQVRMVSVKPELLAQPWQATWIAHPEDARQDFGVYHFRRAFSLDSVPESFVVHVSGDNRYRLFVNGMPVVNGPARGDLPNWRFESIDIGPYLQAGMNVLGATVWNYAEHRPMAQHSAGTGFILQGDSEREAVVNTGAEWKVVRNEGYSPIPLYTFDLRNYIVVGPGERLDAAQVPWGWEQAGFDDASWAQARALSPGSPKGTEAYGVRVGWTLVPRDIPLMEETPMRIPEIERAEGIQATDGFLNGADPLTIPAGAQATILLDQTHLTTAYPVLVTSGGAGATVRLTYAESLYEGPGNQKGNRDVTEGKEMRGYQDVFVLDGGDRRQFQTLWWRTWRYLQLEVETAGEPVTIYDLYGIFTAYPFEQNASFASSDTTLKEIWDVGWRTARLCAGETYFDCPYYEQLQYVGDTRIQALISLYNAGDDRLMRKAITAFDHSRISEGLTGARYPSYEPQVIAPYSLFWIAMIHDYWRHRDDPTFVQQYLTGIRGVLDWYEGHIDDTGMLRPMPWWNFGDWSFPNRGVPPGADDGNSSLISLQFVYALDYAAELADAFNRPGDAVHYRTVSQRVKEAVRRNTWNDGRGLFAETPEQEQYSEHTNVMAVLVDLVPPQEQRTFLEHVLAQNDLTPTTYYYRFYRHQALKKAGLANRYVGGLNPWREMLALGLTTFAEEPDPTRSDAHAWSAAPNYDFLSIVAGITPASPGFQTVRIEPAFGPLSWIKGTMPHPQGPITVDLKRSGASGLEGEVTLPAGLNGSFRWQGREIALTEGSQLIDLPASPSGR